MRDVRAIVTERGAGCDGRLLCQRGASRAGENAAAYGEVVWSWRRDPGVYPSRPCGHGNGGNKGRCAGRAGMSWLFLSNPCAFFHYPIAHGDAGAVGARLSLRPLFKRGPTRCKTRAKSCRGNAFGCLKTESANSVSSRISERSERRSETITTANGFAKGWGHSESSDIARWL